MGGSTNDCISDLAVQFTDRAQMTELQPRSQPVHHSVVLINVVIYTKPPVYEVVNDVLFDLPYSRIWTIPTRLDLPSPLSRYL
jgi:hypothetical protein